jgi:dihydrofolate synthase/folylpolyglutamate synthase
MSYAEAIQFLYGLQLFGTNLGLETTRKLAALAGNPQEKLRFIHVAGTNGKGSTCAMLESIYRAAGLRVGLFTSPHLVSFRERMQVNRQLVSEAEVARLVVEVAAGILPAAEPGCPVGGKNATDSRLKEYFEAVASSGASPGGRMPPSTAGRMPAPTLFEVVTVMALKFFAEQKCDLVIWETGLGGRLDATNIVTPLASVITNIALDHTQWLGDTLEKIAAEKAGIIKPGVPVITAAREPALGVIEEVARKNKAPFTRAEPDITFSREHPASLAGEHQKANAALAVAMVRVLQRQIPATEEQIHSGLAQVIWPGRLQLVERGGQKILLDGAHNVAGAETLRAALEGRGQSEARLLIIGVLGDKDWRAMCDILAPLAGKIFAVPVASARTADARELAAVLKAANPQAETDVFKNVSEALSACGNEPFVVVAGSLYLIGEALEVLGLSPADGGERGLNEWSGRR